MARSNGRFDSRPMVPWTAQENSPGKLPTLSSVRDQTAGALSSVAVPAIYAWARMADEV